MGDWAQTYSTDKLQKDDCFMDVNCNYEDNSEIIVEEKYDINIVQYLLSSYILKTQKYKYRDQKNVGGIIISNFSKGFKSYIDFFNYAEKEKTWGDSSKIYSLFKQSIPVLTKKRKKYIVLDPSDTMYSWHMTYNVYKEVIKLSNSIKKGFTNKSPEFIFNNKQDPVLGHRTKTTWNEKLHNKEYIRRIEGILEVIVGG